MFKLRYKLFDDEPLGGGAPAADVPGDEPKTVSIEDFNKLMSELDAVKANNQALIGEKREETKRRQQEEEARKQAEIEAQKKAGDFESFEQSLQEQFSKKEQGYQSKIEQFTSKLVGQSKKAAQADLLDRFLDKSIGKLALDSMISITLDDNLNPVREFKTASGDLITTDPDKFMEYLEANHASWLKGAQSSGGQTNSSYRPASRGDAKELSRDAFQNLNPAEQMKFINSGGKVK